MRYGIKNRFFLLKNDLLSAIDENRKPILTASILLVCGIALGAFIATKTQGVEPPFGVIAHLFRLEFHPFGYLVSDLIRFLLLSVLASLSFFLPLFHIYPAVAIIFFGKYCGQVACTVLFCDSRISAILGILLIYLPLAIIGGALLLCIWIRARQFRLCRGADSCMRVLGEHALFWVNIALLYVIFLFLIYVLLCGTFYLIVVAI